MKKVLLLTLLGLVSQAHAQFGPLDRIEWKEGDFCDKAASAFVNQTGNSVGTSLYNYKGAAKNVQPFVEKIAKRLSWQSKADWAVNPADKSKLKKYESGVMQVNIALKGNQICIFATNQEQATTPFLQQASSK